MRQGGLMCWILGNQSTAIESLLAPLTVLLWKCEIEIMNVEKKVWKWTCESESVKVNMWKCKCESESVQVWKCESVKVWKCTSKSVKV